MNQDDSVQKEQRIDDENVTELHGVDKNVQLEGEYDSRIEVIRSKSFDREQYKKEASEKRKQIYLLATFMFAFLVLMMASAANPGIYKIDPETLITINQAFNAIVLLVIPFLLGSVGAVARILISEESMTHSGTLVVSSGLMAMFSWVGIKSGVLIAIIAPHLEDKGVATTISSHAPSDFYTMALVAIVVGMFSTNLYLFINQRVEHLTNKASQASESSNNKSQKDA
jgi:hypothetical protein